MEFHTRRGPQRTITARTDVLRQTFRAAMRARGVRRVLDVRRPLDDRPALHLNPSSPPGIETPLIERRVASTLRHG